MRHCDTVSPPYSQLSITLGCVTLSWHSRSKVATQPNSTVKSNPVMCQSRSAPSASMRVRPVSTLGPSRLRLQLKSTTSIRTTSGWSKAHAIVYGVRQYFGHFFRSAISDTLLLSTSSFPLGFHFHTLLSKPLTARKHRPLVLHTFVQAPCTCVFPGGVFHTVACFHSQTSRPVSGL